MDFVSFDTDVTATLLDACVDYAERLVLANRRSDGQEFGASFVLPDFSVVMEVHSGAVKRRGASADAAT